MKKLTASLALTAILVGSIGTAALATTIPASGGTWTYGINNNADNSYHMGYSYYFHPTNTHTSSVSVNGTVYRSPLTSKGNTSIMNGPSTQSTQIGLYYNPNA